MACGTESKKFQLRAKFNPVGCSAWGCSWYFIVSKVVTVAFMNQYYAVLDLRSE